MRATTKVAEAARSLAESGTLSRATAALLAQPDRDVQTPEIGLGFEEPAFACFLIDASGSMKPFAQAVIDGQQKAVAALRQSHKARKQALYAAQWTFANTTRLLNPFKLVSNAGADDIVMLDEQKYQPQGQETTALYQSTFHVLQEIAANVASAKQAGVRAACTIAVITDGEDNEGGVKPSDIRAIVTELKAKKFLARSLVIGIKHASLPMERIDAIKEALGFDDAVSVEKSEKEIRRAFVLASQSAVTAFS